MLERIIVIAAAVITIWYFLTRQRTDSVVQAASGLNPVTGQPAAPLNPASVYAVSKPAPINQPPAQIYGPPAPSSMPSETIGPVTLTPQTGINVAEQTVAAGPLGGVAAIGTLFPAAVTSGLVRIYSDPTPPNPQNFGPGSPPTGPGSYICALNEWYARQPGAQGWRFNTSTGCYERIVLFDPCCCKPVSQTPTVAQYSRYDTVRRIVAPPMTWTVAGKTYTNYTTAALAWQNCRTAQGLPL